MTEIKKRNGDYVAFDSQRIINAVNKAFKEVRNEENNEAAQEIADQIYSFVKGKSNREVDVEHIQDFVEDLLMEWGFKDVARAYIRYRYKKEVARNTQDDFINAIREKLDATNVQNQNANVDEKSFGGRTGEASSVVTKQLALDYIVSPMARANHLNNEIYIHDLDSYYIGSHNCLSIPFDDLLAKGFNTRQTDVRPAQSINTAFQLIAVIFQLQSLNQFGGVAATHLDWTMVPYVRKSFYKHIKDGLMYMGKPSDYKVFNLHFKEIGENADVSIENCDWSNYFTEEFCIPNEVYKYAIDMTERECAQASEGLFHNLNTLQSRSGNQLPFTSINLGTCTLPEGRLVIKSILNACLKGVGKVHKTSIFPCLIFQLGKGINRKPGDPNYDLYQFSLKCTAKRLYPNYANLDWSGNAGYDKNDPRTYFSTINNTVA